MTKRKPKSKFHFEEGSFRDRHGRIVYDSEDIYRLLSTQALANWEALEKTSFFARLRASGQVVNTERVKAIGGASPELMDGWAAALKHQPIPFISYPYEWSFSMLRDAALLHLDLLLMALEEDMVLKDSSAFNVQWEGTRPVFIDIPSFEPYAPGEPWVGYRQFCQMFLYPLLLQAHRNAPFHVWLRGNIDGIDPEEFAKMVSLRDWMRTGVFFHGVLQAKMQAVFSKSSRNVKKDLHASGFSKELIKANASRLRKTVARLKWKDARSQWSNYASEHSYSDPDLDRKKAFVRQVVSKRRWNLVWDVGCNTGVFSRIAAEQARYVVAMDADHKTIDLLYQDLKLEANSNILPLVANLANPSPNQGWRGKERKSLEERGRPELTLALAVIHHVVISANIPLREFVEWLAELGTALVIEFVNKGDPMVQTLLRNKEDIYNDYDQGFFERCLAQNFRVEDQQALASGTRTLYYALPKG